MKRNNRLSAVLHALMHMAERDLLFLDDLAQHLATDAAKGGAKHLRELVIRHGPDRGAGRLPCAADPAVCRKASESTVSAAFVNMAAG